MRKTVKVKCAQCGKEFDKYVKYYKQNEALGHSHYCSRKCCSLHQEQGEIEQCSWCGKDIC